jgi:hypothetical protein
MESVHNWQQERVEPARSNLRTPCYREHGKRGAVVCADQCDSIREPSQECGSTFGILVPQRRCSLGDQLLSLLRDQLGYIILGTVFLFFGLTACAIAAIRQRTDVRVLTWWGIWSGMYGARLLAQRPAVIAL